MGVTIAQATSAVDKMLKGNEYKFSYDQEKNRFQITFNLRKTKLSSCRIYIHIEEQVRDPNLCKCIISYGYASISADSDCMAAIAEYLTRANYGLQIGNFELDHSDGEIRYKVACRVMESLPNNDALEDLIDMPVAMFNRYGNGLLAVSMGMVSAADAIKQAEGE